MLYAKFMEAMLKKSVAYKLIPFKKGVGDVVEEACIRAYTSAYEESVHLIFALIEAIQLLSADIVAITVDISAGPADTTLRKKIIK